MLVSAAQQWLSKAVVRGPFPPRTGLLWRAVFAPKLPTGLLQTSSGLHQDLLSPPAHSCPLHCMMLHPSKPFAYLKRCANNTQLSVCFLEDLTITASWTSPPTWTSSSTCPASLSDSSHPNARPHPPHHQGLPHWLPGLQSSGHSHSKPQHPLGLLSSLVPQVHPLPSDPTHRRLGLLSLLLIFAVTLQVPTLHTSYLDTTWLGGCLKLGCLPQNPSMSNPSHYRSWSRTNSSASHSRLSAIMVYISSLISQESHSLYSDRTCPMLFGFFAFVLGILKTWNSFPPILHLYLLNTLLLHSRSGSDAIPCRRPSAGGHPVFQARHLLLFSRSVVSNSLQPHGLQHARLPCPSPTPRACSQAHVHWISDTKQPSHLLPPSSLFAFDLSQHQGLYQWVGSSHQVPTWSTFTSRRLCSCLTLLRDAEHLEVITKGLPPNVPVISPGIWYGFNMGSTASSDPSSRPPLPLAGTAHIAPEKRSLTSFHLNLCVKTSKQAGIQVVSFHGDFTHFLSSHHIGEGVLPASVSPC